MSNMTDLYSFMLLFCVIIDYSFSTPTRIIGGEPVSVENFPYQLSLSINDMPICGAALISNRYGVTAAHCVYLGKARGESFSVRAGTSNLNKGGETMFVEKAIMHPYYNVLLSDYDLCILQLQKPFNLSDTIQPVQLPRQNEFLPPGSLANVSGFGVFDDNKPEQSTTLRAVEVPILEESECQKDYSSLTLTPRMLCAGYRKGGKDACQGDSGGPLVSNGILYGLVSWGLSCAASNQPGVYTNIASLREFIKINSGV